ncbi:MAG TPA: OmpA family protein [Bryobacteraceae bacterium]|nr:OmpA family protein [Bryobacteraceae bacterium]
MRKLSAYLLCSGCLLLITTTGCKKKAAAVAPPPPPAERPQPPEKPQISLFTASPSSVEKGQSSTLRWAVAHATDVSITPNLGDVQENGSRQIFPPKGTMYTLTAKGPGGSASATASVDVLFPRASTPVPASTPKSLLDRLNAEVKDAYFDFDQSTLRSDARDALKNDANALRSIFREFPAATLNVEGHCDERGSAEYNLALGDRRAQTARDFLVEFGVPSSQLKPISYGKERPVCTEHAEDCWQRNRRAHVSEGQ